MPHLQWPPRIKDWKVDGEVKDTSGRHYPRDIGRPCYLGGNTYYVFGDTFCHDDARNFQGAADTTYALAGRSHQHSLQCQYTVNRAQQPPFIPHTPSEEAYANDPRNKTENNRVVLWSFGGIIEDAPGAKEGWVFFDKMLTHGGQGGKHFGIGVARVIVQRDDTLFVDRLMGDDLIFGDNEPKFGSITHFIGGDGYVYLLGSKDPPAPTLDLHNNWARILHNADFTQKSNYEYLVQNLDGTQTWERSYPALHDLVNALPSQAQGAVLNLPDFAPPGRPYIWFGVNKFGANRLYIGVAPDLKGPWEEWEGPEIPKFGGGGLRYCLYPHERSSKSRLDGGELLLSWSDDGKWLGGMVVQGVIKFALEGEANSRGDYHTTSEQHRYNSSVTEDPGSSGGLKGKAKAFWKSFKG